MTMTSSTAPAGQQACLHIVLDVKQGTLKIGTCFHCVVKEPDRPDRAWNADGDKELDFDRDQLLVRLAVLGVAVEITQEYVCP
jgi:hypothetical protein